MKMKTCGQCALRDLKPMGFAGSFGVWVCTRVGGQRVIPQETTKAQSVFKRVPEWCPLSRDQVEKSEQPQPPGEWHSEKIVIAS